ncbi:MAG: FliO/MopB family protein [Pirellula sp.]|jgi:flagellar biogenesis protein FliO
MHSLSVNQISGLRTSHLIELAKITAAVLLFGFSYAPMATAQMLESQRIRTGQTYPDQMHAGQSNAGLATGEPTPVRGAGHVTSQSQTGSYQDRTQTQYTSDVRPASFEAQPTSVSGLQFPTQPESTKQTQSSTSEIKLKEPSRGNEGRISKPTSPWTTLFSVGFSLGIVVCLFLGVAWIAKKSMPAGSSRLPNEVVEVLGRSTIAPRQQIYVLRFGRKLLLVSQQPGQTQTLSEITDEEEVIRLAGICEANSPRSATRTFSDVLKHVATGKPEPQTRGQRRPA